MLHWGCQLLFPGTAEDAVNDINDLSQVVPLLFGATTTKKNGTKKKKKQNNNNNNTTTTTNNTTNNNNNTDSDAQPVPIEVLNDLLMSLLMRPSSPCQRLLRDVSKALFASLSATKILNHRECVFALADTFVTSNLQRGYVKSL
jgi:hypothetical protein